VADTCNLTISVILSLWLHWRGYIWFVNRQISLCWSPIREQVERDSLCPIWRHRWWSNSMEQSPSSPTVAQLVKKFPAVLETRRFITVFIKSYYWTLSWSSWIQNNPPSHFLTIHFNIILPFTSRFPKWSLHSGFPTKVFVFFSSSPWALRVVLVWT
jgi:hypothetical protein